MALKAYEDACLRAELFGQQKPDKDEFLASHKHLDVVEFEEVDIKTAENTAMLTEDIKASSGGITELNTILNSTQTKLNRLKGVCGSLTSFFRAKLMTGENLSYSTGPSYVGQTNFDRDSDYVVANNSTDLGSVNSGLGPEVAEMTSKDGRQAQNGGDINTALNDLKTMQDSENTALISKSTAKDVKGQMSDQISKLDKIICQADRAQTSLSHQNKQMRSMLR